MDADITDQNCCNFYPRFPRCSVANICCGNRVQPQMDADKGLILTGLEPGEKEALTALNRLQRFLIQSV